MKAYEFYEHTSDVLFKAYGKTLDEAYENAAKAVFATMVKLQTVKCELQKQVAVEADDKEGLLRKWINELVFIFDTEHVLFSDFKVEISKKIGSWKLEAKCCGEKYDEKRHKISIVVKAATYHMMEIHDEKNKCWVQVIVDV